MKVKVDKTSLIKYVVYLVFLLDICFWFLFPMETSFTGVYNKKLITIIVMLLTFVTVLATNFFWKKSFRFLLLFSFAYLFDLVALVMYSKSQYPAQGFGGTMAMAYYYLDFLIVFPMLYVLLKDTDYRIILEGLNKIAVILICIIALQGIVYALTGSIFMKGVLSADDIQMRSGRIRIGMTLLGNYAVIYNFAKIQKKQCRIIHYVGFVAGILDVFFVQMTRMYELAIIGALLAVYISSSKKTTRFIRIIVVLFAIVYIMSFTGILDSFISSFDVNGELGAGTRVRFEAIEYFMTFVQKNPLFGMGFVHQNFYLNVLYGSSGRYYLSDVGIIGLITEGGLGMGLLYIIFCLRMIFILVKTRDTRSPFLVGLMVFILLCTPTLVVWGRRTIIYIGLALAVFEFHYFESKKFKKEIAA